MNIITKLLGLIIVAALVVILLIPTVTESNDDKILNVLVIDGQSNAEYGDSYVCNAVDLNAEYMDVPDHNLYYLGTDTTPGNLWQWQTTYNMSWAGYHLEPMYNYSTSQWIIGGYEPILGNSIASRSGNDTLIVNMGVGARTIAQLLPDGDSGAYSWGVLDRAVALAEYAGYTINMIGVVWIQGEADKDTAVDSYVQSFTTLESAFSDRGLNRIYIVHTRDTYGGNANTAQEQIAASNPDVEIATYITDTFTQDNGMLASNADIHYSQKGRTTIAEAIETKITVPEVKSSNDHIEQIEMILPLIVLAGIVLSVIRLAIDRRD